MSNYTPPPTDEELEQIKPLGGWRWMMAYPCFVVLAAGQVVRRRWAKLREGR